MVGQAWRSRTVASTGCHSRHAQRHLSHWPLAARRRHNRFVQRGGTPSLGEGAGRLDVRSLPDIQPSICHAARVPRLTILWQDAVCDSQSTSFFWLSLLWSRWGEMRLRWRLPVRHQHWGVVLPPLNKDPVLQTSTTTSAWGTHVPFSTTNLRSGGVSYQPTG